MISWKLYLEQKAHEFSSTQIDIPQPLASQILEWAKGFIDSADLAEDGFEEEPHITVLFGLHADEPDEVENLLAVEKKITVKLQQTSMFEGKEYDVIKFSVDSPDLVALNEKLKSLEHTQTHPNYIPHCTIAYVKKGTGKKYIGDRTFFGKEIVANEVLFSDKNREKTSIHLS